ncbi:unnamed protein product [Prorocentrum cordatum]|uniref:RING-type domain-containing protein n=1 Tax=Prorocentrum cordatum TaxID=2364126 RepID=A0ABN9TD47_9DINO|nr:unnamed protein product [Polarella glacialis]
MIGPRGRHRGKTTRTQIVGDSACLVFRPAETALRAAPLGEGEPACVVCAEAAAVATFVHGATGHTACCVPCAEELQRRRDLRCPVCRQPFTSVIRTFSA